MFRNLCLFALIFCSSLEAAYTLKNGKLIPSEDVATHSVHEHYSLGIKAVEDSKWNDAVRQFRIVTINFDKTTFARDARFLLGKSYYHAGELEFANTELTTYLEGQNNPKHFEAAFLYKFAIADHFREGAKRRAFGSKRSPKWFSGKELALEIYDEIITSLGSHDLAAKSLYWKAEMLASRSFYRSSRDTLQLLIKKFPKHELSADAYVKIAKLYLKEIHMERQNPDLLPLAEINLRHFREAFPRDLRIEKAEKVLAQMRELYAKGLHDTGRFYERKGLPRAAGIYYRTALSEYPETQFSKKSDKRLKFIRNKYPWVDDEVNS